MHFNSLIDLYAGIFLLKETGYEGQGMIVTLQADLDPYPDLFRPVMREIIGRSRSPQGILGPFPGLLLRARREITGPQAL